MARFLRTVQLLQTGGYSSVLGQSLVQPPSDRGRVILAENQKTGEFSLVDLGCWQRLSIREIQETADPAVVRIFFTDGIVFDGSEYYTRTFADSVDYSLAAGEVTAENSLCVPGRYGMVGDSVEYRHRFGDCEVTNGRIALRFAVTGTTGWEGYPRSTEVVLPEVFQSGEPGGDSAAEGGARTVSGVPCGLCRGGGDCLCDRRTPSRRGRRPAVITPKPGYTVACGFDSPDSVDWGETLWVWSEKR